MTFARIPGVPLPVAGIILGTSSLEGLPWAWGGSRRARSRIFELLEGVLESGGNAFDTARVYGLGASERILGDWMKKTGVRDKVVLITKGAHPSLLTFRGRLRSAALNHDLEASLRALRTGWIDLYLLHRDDPAVPVAAVMEMLHEARGKGVIRAYGVSNWSHRRIAEANRFARTQGIAELSASSPQFSLAEWRRPPFPGCVSISGDGAADARDWYRGSGLTVLAWSSLAAGSFVRARADGGESVSPRPRKAPAAYRVAANEDRFARAARLARMKRVTPAQVALAYLVSHPFPVFPIISTRSVDRFRENAEALGLHLTPAEREWLERGEKSEHVLEG